MTILPRHKDVAKSRLNLRNPWHLLATGFGSGAEPRGAGHDGLAGGDPFLVFDDVSAVAALFGWS
ncbi:phosphatidylglycerophosphatase A [Salmonella enterica subsp. enterica]|nr:phosphatidylglycerophosphatase A [Salmonella enterica subsp. enterica]